MNKHGLSRLTLILLIAFSFSSVFQLTQSGITEKNAGQDLNNSPHQTANASWTVMSWINADSEGEHDALDALQELELGFIPNDEINVVSFVDRNMGLDSSNGDWTGGKYFEVRGDDDTRVISSLEVMDLDEVNQGDPATLRNFVTWAQTNYPADNYVLTYIGHGFGIGGMSFDKDNNYDGLTIDEIAVALNGLHIDLFVLDGCAMGTIEIAYEWRSFTDYLLMSEEVAQKEGLDYEYALTELQKNPNMSPEEFGVVWIDSAVLPIQYPLVLTRSLIKTSMITNLVESVSNFSISLQDLNSSEIAVISALRQSITLFETFMADLYYFAELVYESPLENLTLKSSAFDVMTKFNQTVIHEYHGPNDPQVRGLSIYFPVHSSSQTWFSDYLTASSDYQFNRMDFLSDTLWNEFLIYYLARAPIVTPAPIEFTDIELNSNYNVINPLKNEAEFYSIILDQRGIYNFYLDVLQGDVQMYVSAKPGTGTTLSVPLWAGAQNPNQTTFEQIVIWLEEGTYQVEIVCLQDNCNSILEVSKQNPVAMNLDDVFWGEFPPRRGGAGPPIQVIHDYYEVDLEVGSYEICVDGSDHALLYVAVWVGPHSYTIAEFRGNEGQDYLETLSITDARAIIIDIFAHAWSGSYSMSISKNHCDATPKTSTGPTGTESGTTITQSVSTTDNSSLPALSISLGLFAVTMIIRRRKFTRPWSQILK